MKEKPSAPDEFRMSAAEFDKAMRGALSAPSPGKANPVAKPAKRTKKKTENEPQ